MANLRLLITANPDAHQGIIHPSPSPPFFNDSWASEGLLADTKPTILMSALADVSLKLHLKTSNEIFQNKQEPSHARDVIP